MSTLFHSSAWLQTYVRARTFHFSNPFALDEPAVFFVKAGNSFDWRDITGKTIGFGAGWVWDEFCVAREPKIKVRVYTSLIMKCNIQRGHMVHGNATMLYGKIGIDSIALRLVWEEGPLYFGRAISMREVRVTCAI